MHHSDTCCRCNVKRWQQQFSGAQKMPLNPNQIICIEEAINNYDFPAEWYDFTDFQGNALLKVNRIKGRNIGDVEKVIFDQLTSQNPERLKDGLSNVLYWGYANMGFRD